jgi:hypothetical protein
MSQNHFIWLMMQEKNNKCCLERFRITWVVIFVTSSALFSYMIASKIELLASKDKIIDVNVDYLAQLPFPAVTVCNKNRYRYMST